MADLGATVSSQQMRFPTVVMTSTVREPVLNCLDREPGAEARVSPGCLGGSAAIGVDKHDGGGPNTDRDGLQHLR